MVAPTIEDDGSNNAAKMPSHDEQAALNIPKSEEPASGTLKQREVEDKRNSAPVRVVTILVD